MTLLLMSDRHRDLPVRWHGPRLEVTPASESAAAVTGDPARACRHLAAILVVTRPWRWPVARCGGQASPLLCQLWRSSSKPAPRVSASKPTTSRRPVRNSGRSDHVGLGPDSALNPAPPPVTHPPTLVGVLVDLYFVLIGFIEDVILSVVAAVTVRNLFLFFLFVLSVYITRKFWRYLCETKSVHRMVAYVSAVKAWREMWRLWKQMHWWEAVVNVAASFLYTICFLIHLFMFSFWGCYCFLGSIFTQLDTYTEAQVAVELKVKQSVNPSDSASHSEEGVTEALASVTPRRVVYREGHERCVRMRAPRAASTKVEARSTVDTTEIEEGDAPMFVDLREFIANPGYLDAALQLGQVFKNRKRPIVRDAGVSDEVLEQDAEGGDDNSAVKRSKRVAVGPGVSIDDSMDSE
jgi:hypothetical protein